MGLLLYAMCHLGFAIVILLDSFDILRSHANIDSLIPFSRLFDSIF